MPQRHEIIYGAGLVASCVGAAIGTLVFDDLFLKPDVNAGISLEAGPPSQKLGDIATAECAGVMLNMTGCAGNSLEPVTTTTSSTTTTTSAPARPAPTRVSRNAPRVTTTTAVPEPVVPTQPPTIEGEWRRIDLGTFESTCYALPPKGTQGGPGSIAVDPRVIPMGTELDVEGYGRGQARDTGRAIKGRIIDVWKPSVEECMQWGRRAVRVVMLERVA